MTALAALTNTEAKLALRDPTALVIPVGLPLLIIVMNGANADRTGETGLGSLPGFDAVLVPLALAMVVVMIAVVNMPTVLATYRTTGVLRRLATTPASPTLLLVAQVLVSLAQVMVGVALALSVAVVAFDVALPSHLGVAVAVLALGLAASYGLGMLVAAVAPSANGATAMGVVAFFGMIALAGVFGPVEALPGWLGTLGEHTPYGALATALTDAWTGTTPGGTVLAALAGTALVGGAVAAGRFRWDTST